MEVAAPFPASLSLVGLAAPVIFLAGRGVARRLSRRRALRRALAPGIALAIWLLSIHAAGLATHSFVGALVVGTLGLVAGVLALAWRARSRMPPGPSLGPATSFAALFVVALTTLPVAYMAFAWAFHDEYMYTGHLSVTSEIQNGFYPPRHMAFPDVELRYHYGFNLLAAFISAMGRTRVDTGIDIATVGLWVYTAYLLWVLGDLWLGRGRGWVTLLAVLFAGGLPVCLTQKKFQLQQLVGVCDVKGSWTLPPVLGHFFQHPWGLGLPLAVAALLVFSAHDCEGRRVRLAVLALLLATLSIGQVVLFATMMPTLLACEALRIVRFDRRKLRGLVGLAAAAVVVAVAATRLGGFLGSQTSAGLVNSIVVKPWIVGDRHDALLWHAQSFGLVLPLGLLGVPFVSPRGRLPVALLLAGSLGVLNSLHYAYSWDMAKFGCTAEIAMGFGVAALAGRALRARPGSGIARRLAGALAAVVLVAATTVGGVAYALFIPLFPKVAGGLFNKQCWTLGDDDVRAASFLRTRVKVGELVFRRQFASVGYAQWAGLPSPWLDWAVYAFGFPYDRTGPREALLKSLPASADAYRKQRIVWFVLEPDDKSLMDDANQWVASGLARDVVRFGTLRVVKLVDPAPAR